MNISAPFIERPIATSLLTVALLLAGAVAFPHIPVAPLPEVEYPTITVNANLPGASPETMASSVATPLERMFGRIAGINQMTSLQPARQHVSSSMQFDLIATSTPPPATCRPPSMPRAANCLPTFRRIRIGAR